ncbi:FHF complex subunit HOOK interacting protein 2A-like isoform X2 [Physella acuta]|uniref:FHF complex subunit HOOK interacting protein 2A-like isoform X2 n=1 Tax=Physella acuta TaxID=109671 RepID=UPI0027DD2B87|nr:FHF complex subunit HOOK interacting protein 2A-like isoform X2 [Physella acuta]
MKKIMFHKFTNFIQQAVETFAPNVTPQEEFIYHWKSVTSYFIDNKDGGARIEETALPEHLTSMLRILQEEESNLGEAGTTGMCMEYLLQHRLLETLYTLGRTDHPPGMKQCVLSFFTKLLSRVSHPLLPHINVHRAVQRLVKTCGETKAGPTEKEEIEFLCTVCAKIKTDPYLVNFFIENPKTSDRLSGSNIQKKHQTFSLVDALLSLAFSEDARVSVKACEGLMLCASLPEQSAASALITQTQFTQLFANTLSQLYTKLPLAICPDDIEMVDAKWGFDDVNERHSQQGFTGKRQVISFLSWLDYCDQLISLANPDVGEALSLEIHSQFLTGQMLPHLMQTSESGVLVATTYLTRCLRTVCSPALLREFCFFLLGQERNIEEKDCPGHLLTKRLLERCNHLSEEVCLATLKLFDTLLQKEDEHIFHSLLIRNVLGRNYLLSKAHIGKKSSPEEATAPRADVETCNTGSVEASAQIVPHETSNSLEDPLAAQTNVAGISSDVQQTSIADQEGSCLDQSHTAGTSVPHSSTSSSDPSYESPVFGPSEIHKVVNCYLSLLPEEAKSSQHTADSGYDMYLRDANKQFAIAEAVCKGWVWPKKPVAIPEYKRDTFFEGSFLHILLDKLLHLLDQSYSVNLLLTALISKVALIPHPNLHEFLLDPFLPVPDGTRTLYTVLTKVTNEIKHHLKSDPSFTQKLLLARKQLLGNFTTLHSDRGRFEDQSRMEAIIVLEEFCKELSAIIFVKHHAAVTRC